MAETDLSSLKDLLRARDTRFATELVRLTKGCSDFQDALTLHTLRRRGTSIGVISASATKIKLAIIGAATLRPLADLIEHFTTVLVGAEVDLWVGEVDNYTFEIMEPESELFEFKPDYVVLLPSEQRCRFGGHEEASTEAQVAETERAADGILELAKTIRNTCGAEVLVSNFRLPASYDPGPARWASLKSDYAFRKMVNTQLGLRAPQYVHLVDVEFLANRMGTVNTIDDRTWFESKQPYSSPLLVEVAKEVSLVLKGLRTAPKKVIVLDLDNTVWGGIIGDDGLEGIEIGTTSPRGEAFRAFQQYLLGLTRRGVLLAVCSKNDHEKAVEPFLRHPEMVLRLENIVNFKANWDPKSENIRQIATELNLGLDSFVFMDDNPAEIEIGRQFVPEVTCIWAGDDPSLFIPMLQNSRLFEYRNLTAEDMKRVVQYQQEAKRQELASTATDMGSYLSSLEMVAKVSNFNSLDTPRISQLINKSNQFNLTTIRRSEAEVQAVSTDPDHSAFTIRLSDRFGDHGLIAVVVLRREDTSCIVDTWLMSCRVLKRQVEELTLNIINKRAETLGCDSVVGIYRPTAKNGMVRDLYPKLGFALMAESDEEVRFNLKVSEFKPFETKISAGDF